MPRSTSFMDELMQIIDSEALEGLALAAAQADTLQMFMDVFTQEADQADPETKA